MKNPNIWMFIIAPGLILIPIGIYNLFSPNQNADIIRIEHASNASHAVFIVGENEYKCRVFEQQDTVYYASLHPNTCGYTSQGSFKLGVAALACGSTWMFIIMMAACCAHCCCDLNNRVYDTSTNIVENTEPTNDNLHQHDPVALPIKVIPMMRVTTTSKQLQIGTGNPHRIVVIENPV